MRKNQKIHFHYLTKGLTLTKRERLKRFVENLISSRRRLNHVNYIFCSDNYLLELNRKYLKHDTFTDIITFELSLPSEPITADIYISADRVKDNAKQFRTSTKNEIHRVIFHGALHLIGFKDSKPSQARRMRKMEEECLEKYFRST